MSKENRWAEKFYKQGIRFSMHHCHWIHPLHLFPTPIQKHPFLPLPPSIHPTASPLPTHLVLVDVVFAISVQPPVTVLMSFLCSQEVLVSMTRLHDVDKDPSTSTWILDSHLDSTRQFCCGTHILPAESGREDCAARLIEFNLAYF